MENILIFAQEQFVVVISLTAIVFLFVRHEASKGGEKLSCPQVVAAVNADEAILLDVRDTKEYDAGHIVNAISMPHAKVADSLNVLEKHRQKKIIVIDKMGQQSAAVVKTLVANDFTAVRLGGGISDWQQDNLPLVK
ncbi:MAG: rhodanese-related sulfurtransferase [Candidatus Endobugula sp.]